MPILTDFTEFQTSANRGNSEGLPSYSVHCALNKNFYNFQTSHFLRKNPHHNIFRTRNHNPHLQAGCYCYIFPYLESWQWLAGLCPPSEPACFFIWGFSGRDGKYLWVFPPLCLRQPERNTAYQGFIYREMPVFCRRMVGLRMGGGQAVYGPSNHFRHRSGHNSFHSYTAACSKETTHPH